MNTLFTICDKTSGHFVYMDCGYFKTSTVPRKSATSTDLEKAKQMLDRTRNCLEKNIQRLGALRTPSNWMVTELEQFKATKLCLVQFTPTVVEE